MLLSINGYKRIDTDLKRFPRSSKCSGLNIRFCKKDLQVACHSFWNFTLDRVRSLRKKQALKASKEFKDRLCLGHIEKNIAFLSMMKSLVAPLIEAIILLDRFCYYKEKGMEVTLLPLFDRKISPRNFVFGVATPNNR
jgi:hypothetical protein